MGRTAVIYTTPRTVYLTPLLMAGDAPVNVECEPAEDMWAALNLIHQSRVALVPTLDLARQVLAGLDLTEDEIDERVHFGLTGQVLYGAS